MRASDSDIYLKWRKATQQTGLKQLILARERAKHEHLCVKGTHDSVKTRDAETCEHGCSKTTASKRTRAHMYARDMQTANKHRQRDVERRRKRARARASDGDVYQNEMRRHVNMVVAKHDKKGD